MLPTLSLQQLSDRWIIVGKLGKGTYARVYLARPAQAATAPAEQVAVKRYKRIATPEYGLHEPLVRELSLLRRHQHPHLIRLYEICYASNTVCAILEYMPTTLELVLDAHPEPYAWTSARAVLVQVLRALAYLHSCRVVHRDVAVGNIFLSSPDLSSAIVKLGDLNLSRIQTATMTPGMVTLNYRAPELMNDCEQYGPGVDVWACGCIAAEMVRGSVLFDGDSELEMLAEILGTLGKPDPRLAKRLGINLKTMQRLLRRAQARLQGRGLADRLHTDEAEAVKMIEAMLELDPDRRISAQQCLDCLDFTL